jgi:hypothetical protein
VKVLLLNPPGERIYIRDYFCSKTTKSNYLFHPVDLVALTGTLASQHTVEVLDCMAERLDPAQARAFDPEVVLSLVGSVSWNEDRAFLSEQHQSGRRVLVIGDVLHERSEQRLQAEAWIEAALHDFSNEDCLHYLAGNRERVLDMTLRQVDGTPQRIQAGARKGQFHGRGMSYSPSAAITSPLHALRPLPRCSRITAVLTPALFA